MARVELPQVRLLISSVIGRSINFNTPIDSELNIHLFSRHHNEVTSQFIFAASDEKMTPSISTERSMKYSGRNLRSIVLFPT
jgi:hypothetical protein